MAALSVELGAQQVVEKGILPVSKQEEIKV